MKAKFTFSEELSPIKGSLKKALRALPLRIGFPDRAWKDLRKWPSFHVSQGATILLNNKGVFDVVPAERVIYSKNYRSPKPCRINFYDANEEGMALTFRGFTFDLSFGPEKDKEDKN